MFNHIIVGADGSPESGDAVALAAAIADVSGSRLTLVGVFPTPLLPVQGMTDRRTLRREAEHVLRRERGRLAPHALVRTVADNSVPRALSHYAERSGADLVVIGSHPAAEKGHVAISRRGRQLLSHAPFSVAVAARGLADHPHPLQTIGVGYDGDAESELAMKAASWLARSTHAHLHVHRVVEDQIPPLVQPPFALEEWRRLWEEERIAALTETRTAIAPISSGADVTCAIGDPGYELREFSASVDLLVVGSRRWGPVARLVTGGAGETLAGDARSSLLFVPRPARAPGRQSVRRRSVAAPSRSAPAAKAMTMAMSPSSAPEEPVSRVR